MVSYLKSLLVILWELAGRTKSLLQAERHRPGKAKSKWPVGPLLGISEHRACRRYQRGNQWPAVMRWLGVGKAKARDFTIDLHIQVMKILKLKSGFGVERSLR